MSPRSIQMVGRVGREGAHQGCSTWLAGEAILEGKGPAASAPTWNFPMHLGSESGQGRKHRCWSVSAAVWGSPDVHLGDEPLGVRADTRILTQTVQEGCSLPLHQAVCLEFLSLASPEVAWSIERVMVRLGGTMPSVPMCAAVPRPGRFLTQRTLASTCYWELWSP